MNRSKLNVHTSLLLAMLLLFLIPSKVQAMTLPEEVSIQCPAGQPAIEMTGNELASFLKQSGVCQSVTLSREAKELIRLSLRKDLQPEQVWYEIGNDMIRIESGSPRGLLYSVWEFCERELGVRFLTSDQTYIPELKPGMLLQDWERDLSLRDEL
jgi:hypothetical protein